MIVAGTSVWIDFLEARETSFDFHLKDLIERNALVALTDIIYCEILQGISTENQFRRIRGILQAYPIFQAGDLSTFEHAANIYRACRKKGLTIRRTADCLIAATCLEAGAELYHNDRDFEAIARTTELKIYRPK